jgi:multidrug resistance efflux pump
VGLDAASLTAAGAFVTSVGSLAAVVLSHLKNQRELELEHRMREKELELEQARLELERIKVEAQREGNDDG